MTITSTTTRPTRDPLRRTARLAGVLYLFTFISMPTLILYQRDSASDTGVLIGAFSEVVVALSCIGTAVVLYPVLRRWNETAAMGFVASRVVEGTLIVVGVIGVLTMVTLPRDPGSATAGVVLSAAHGWTFLLSQSLMPVFNALFLGSVLYRSGLVPRVLPLIGLIGAPLLLASDIAVFFGAVDRMAPVAALAALPIAVWEFSLGIYLTVKGFRPAAVSALLGRPVDPRRSVAG